MVIDDGDDDDDELDEIDVIEIELFDKQINDEIDEYEFNEI